jgi:hypothetical protein
MARPFESVVCGDGRAAAWDTALTGILVALYPDRNTLVRAGSLGESFGCGLDFNSSLPKEIVRSA